MDLSDKELLAVDNDFLRTT